MGLEGGGYGGQPANWIITRTDRFRAAIPTAGISNLVTQNCLSYYHDYLTMEYGDFPVRVVQRRMARQGGPAGRQGRDGQNVTWMDRAVSG